MSAAEQIHAETGRLEGQRNRALARAEALQRNLEGLNERRIALAPPAFTGDEAADRELMALEAQAGRLSREARLVREAASELGRLVEKAEARRTREECRAHLQRYVGLSEERNRLEVGLEEDMRRVLDGLERLGKLDDAQHKEARAAGLSMERRDRAIVAGWLSIRLRDYLPIGEVGEAYCREPLFEADEQNPEPAGEY
jgi:hypothetical protein